MPEHGAGAAARLGIFDAEELLSIEPLGTACVLHPKRESSGCLRPVLRRLLTLINPGFEAINRALKQRLSRARLTERVVQFR